MSLDLEIVPLIEWKFPEARYQQNWYCYDPSDGQGVRFLIWKLSEAAPTRAELEVWWTEYQAHRAAIAYREKRAKAYPPIGDQLDALWKMIEPPPGSEAEAMKAQIMAVKAKYPKGGG